MAALGPFDGLTDFFNHEIRQDTGIEATWPQNNQICLFNSFHDMRGRLNGWLPLHGGHQNLLNLLTMTCNLRLADRNGPTFPLFTLSLVCFLATTTSNSFSFKFLLTYSFVEPISSKPTQIGRASCRERV